MFSCPPSKEKYKQLASLRYKSRHLFLWHTNWTCLKLSFFQLEEDERRLSKLSVRDEDVGLESDEEETGMIFYETKYQKYNTHKDPKKISIFLFLFFTGLQRPSTGKEARRQRSAKITADLENDAPVFDDDFYRYSFVYLGWSFVRNQTVLSENT